MNSMLSAGAIVVAALVTYLTRALPFLAFGRRPLPRWAAYLGQTLPPAIMAVLVVYCLRGADFLAASHGILELAACAVVIAVHLWRKSMYLSVAAGTVCYMLLTHLF